MDQPEEWAWERTRYDSSDERRAGEDYYARRLHERTLLLSPGAGMPQVFWPGSVGLGPWVGDGVHYFHHRSHWGSQWHPSTFSSPQGVVYGCTEQYMMHRKAMLFGDADIAEAIMATDDPARQKWLGKQVGGFDQAVWDAECREVVYFGNLLKFSQHAALRAQLLGTGELILAEASEADSIWGIGMGVDDAQQLTAEQALLNGQNLLGEALMRVRNEVLHWEVYYMQLDAAGNGW
mmetsp:Transcript_65198/g.180793  ORF Transcript_65198/g.180793 Transcript_65198/m.180793 type:complete len:235 (+) Transcript_65198:32-736(+)|eukprot:CAMPEP_0119526878 /NCGR_PEP_ID=MMETSP1344-20130328/41410_1 /TAXON_ID=236787 /ORGANISM="Florenciella parvula, Strain CCMP2471" /LENGTH=234 /DNA_ID=CAMNT_0007565969 /DNA_START=61 /DNA_END=762 /DNA_ORIENTATION=-